MRCENCDLALRPAARFCSACGRRVTSPDRPASRTPGVWIVVLVLAGVAIPLMVLAAGIVAAIAVPNFLQAIDRGKQRRTMNEIRALATAIEDYAIDHDAYPVASDIDDLRAILVPGYAQRLTTLDAWGHPLVVVSDDTGYEIVSTGKDGVSQGCDDGPVQGFDADICFADGEFTQWPGTEQPEEPETPVPGRGADSA